MGKAHAAFKSAKLHFRSVTPAANAGVLFTRIAQTTAPVVCVPQAQEVFGDVP